MLSREDLDGEEIKSRRADDAGGGSARIDEGVRSDTARPLPAPDRNGVIFLGGPGPWHPSDIPMVGELTIEGAADTLSEIVIDERPLRLWAESVKLRHIRIVCKPANATGPPKRSALVLVQSQELLLEGCLFDAGRGPAREAATAANSRIAPPTGPALVAWKLLDAAEQRGGRATIRNSILSGDGPGLYLAHPARRVEFDNVLKTGTGPLVQLAVAPAANSTTVLRLNHATCRASGAILRWIVPAERKPAGDVLIEAGGCVFDVRSPGAALFEFVGTEPPAPWLRSVRLTGEGSIVPPNLEVAGWISTADGSLSAVEPAGIDLEGIFAGPFTFAGPPGTTPHDAEIVDCEAPRRGTALPGIRAFTLPGARADNGKPGSEATKPN
jgi:hypothetical protein